MWFRATLSIYTLENDTTLSIDDANVVSKEFELYPNPSRDLVFFSRPGDYLVYDLFGREVKNLKNAPSMSVNNLQAGTYIVTNSDGASKKLIVK